MSEPQQHKGAQHGRRHSQQNSRRKAPALVKRRQSQEDDRQRQEVNQRRTLRFVALDERRSAPRYIHVGGQHLAGHLHDGLHRLLRRYAVGRCDVQGDRAVKVELRNIGRADRVAHADESRHGHALVTGVLHEIAVERRAVRPIIGCGRQIGLVQLSETVEIVDVSTTQIGRYGRIDVAQLHPFLHGVGFVDHQPSLRDAGVERRGGRSDFRPAAQRIEVTHRLLAQVSRTAPFQILRNGRQARRDAQTRNRRRDEGEALGLGQPLVEHPVERRGDLHGRAFAVGVVDQLDEDHAAVGFGDAGQHVEPSGIGGILHFGQRADDAVGPDQRLLRHPQRRCFGGIHHDHHVAHSRSPATARRYAPCGARWRRSARNSLPASGRTAG